MQACKASGYHQPVVHANFAEAGSNRVDVLLVDPWFEQFDREGCRDTWTGTTKRAGPAMWLELHDRDDLEDLTVNVVLTLFYKVLIEKTAQNGCWYVAVGQQDAGQHGQFVALRLRESL